jgi:hypothetical protein
MFWGTALEMTWEEPLSGIGLAGFPYEFPGAYGRSHGGIGVTDSATNAVLEVAAECGLPGLALAFGAVLPLLLRAWRAAFSSAPLDPLERAAGASLLGLLVACQTGSHLRFPEIGLSASLVAGFLFTRGEDAREQEPREAASGREHLAGILAAAGVIGAAVAVLPTARPAAPFRLGRWIGVYGPGPSPNPFRWCGPRVCRKLEPGEESVSFRVQNARPDGVPIALAIDIDGRRRPPVEIPADGAREVSVPFPPGAQVLCVIARPPFVPHDLTGSADYRRLSFRLAAEDVR